MTHRISRTAMRLGLLPAGIALALRAGALPARRTAAPAAKTPPPSTASKSPARASARSTSRPRQPVLLIDPRRHRGAGLPVGRRHPAEHHRRRFAGDQPHLAAVLGRSRRWPVHRPAQPGRQPHPDPGQRQAPGHHQRRPAGRRLDPGRDGRAHRSAEGRRLDDLRLRRDRRRGQHHHPPELRRRRSQRLPRPVRPGRRHAPGL